MGPIYLNPFEEAFCRLEYQTLGAFRGMILCSLDGCIEAEFLQTALDQLQHRHPKLRAAIAGSGDGRLQFQFSQNTPPIPFEIKDSNDDLELAWRDETRRLFNVTFPATGPFAAVAVLRNRIQCRSELMLSVHHAIADGLSDLTLLENLLAEYAIAESHETVAPRPSLLPVSAVRAKRASGWGARLWVLRKLLRTQWKQWRSRTTELPEEAGVAPQSQWVRWVFSPEESEQLLRRCKGERTSIRAATVAAVCCGLMDCLPVSRAYFKCQFPFTIRDVLETHSAPITGEDMGCFVIVTNEVFEVPQSPAFWDLARHAYQVVRTFVQHGGPAFYYNMGAALSRLSSALTPARRSQDTSSGPLPKTEGEVRPTLLTSHFGEIQLREVYGSLRPSGCTLLFNRDGFGPSLMLQTLVMGKRLHVGFAADGLEPEFWDRLQRAVRSHLDAAVGRPITSGQPRDSEGQLCA